MHPADQAVASISPAPRVTDADEPARTGRVVLTGTPGGLWVRAVSAGACVAVDEYAWQAADDVLSLEGDVRLLVFVEPAVIGLAARISLGDDVAPAAWLAQWRQGAQGLVRLVQTRPDLCVAVDFEEASRAPGALTGLVAAELGVDLKLDEGRARPDPLGLALAVQFCGQRSAETRLHDMLIASCVPLAADLPAAPPLMSPEAALNRYRQLQASWAALEQAIGLLGATQPGGSIVDLLRTMLAERDELRASRVVLESAAAGLSGDGALRLAQLYAIQEELERVCLERQGLQAEVQRGAAEIAVLRSMRDASEKLASESAAQQRAAAGERDALAQEAAAARAKAAQLLTQLDAIQEELEEQRSARNASEVRLAEEQSSAEARASEFEARLVQEGDRLKAAQTDTTQLLAQLHRVQEELEKQFLAFKAAEDRLAGERKAAGARSSELETRLAREHERLQATQTDAKQLRAQLHQIQAELETMFVALKAAEQKLTESRRAQRARAVELASLREERDLLAAKAERRLAALKSVRDACEAEREKLAALAESRLAALRAERLERNQQAALRAAEHRAAVAAGRLVHGGMVVVRERLEPPYRELSLEIRDLQLRGIRANSASIRLVEHHGRAGLVVFGELGGEHWLRGWHETGREGDRPFALLIPGDAMGDAALRDFDGTDWRALKSLLDGIEDCLANPGLAETAPLWADVVIRLRSLLETDAWLRADHCEILRGEGDGEAIGMALHGVAIGGRDAGTLRLRWQRAGDAALALLPDAWGRYPLLHPSDDLDTAAQQGQPLVLAAGVPLKLRTQALSSMTAADREFLLGCVAALPVAWRDAADGEAGMPAALKAQIEGVARDAAVALEEARPLLSRLAGLTGRLRSPKRA